MVDLHSWPTPNGKKVTILLEECGWPYNLVPGNIGRGDQLPRAISQNLSEQSHHGGTARATALNPVKARRKYVGIE